MGHVNELIDYTVVAYLVYQNKVLLCHHSKLDMWVPVGGHIELNEDPEEALFREVAEETGLEIELVASKPPLEFQASGTKFLPVPEFMNIHAISPGHRHVVFIYFARAKSSEAKLAPAEHKALRWFTKEELETVGNVSVAYYAAEALKRLGENSGPKPDTI